MATTSTPPTLQPLRHRASTGPVGIGKGHGRNDNGTPANEPARAARLAVAPAHIAGKVARRKNHPGPVQDVRRARGHSNAAKRPIASWRAGPPPERTAILTELSSSSMSRSVSRRPVQNGGGLPPRLRRAGLPCSAHPLFVGPPTGGGPPSHRTSRPRKRTGISDAISPPRTRRVRKVTRLPASGRHSRRMPQVRPDRMIARALAAGPAPALQAATASRSISAWSEHGCPGPA